MVPAEFSPVMSTGGAGLPEPEFPDLFEGPEKTLTLCFKTRRIAGHSLRLVPQDTWSEVLKHARCEILSAVESAAPPMAVKCKEKQCKEKVVASKGLTAYLLSESSLFVSDNSVVLKTCGTTTPLRALEPILDVAVPTWRTRDPESYMKYATFTRLGYMRPGDQVEPHTSWTQECDHMQKHFKGESVVLGSEVSSVQHVYVANYLPKGEVVDVCSTEVILTELDTNESMRRYGNEGNRTAEEERPFLNMWKDLHGDERRSPAARAVLDEKFFEPIGYSANGVFGKNFTTVHITPQPGCSYLSMETSLPLNREARQKFAEGVTKWCKSDAITVTEFSLSPNLLGGAAPQVAGFDLTRTTTTSGTTFACAHHHYNRSCGWANAPPRPALSVATVSPLSTPGPSPALRPAATPAPAEQLPRFQQLPSSKEAEKDEDVEVVLAADVGPQQLAATVAAERLLGRPGGLDMDVPMALVDLAALQRQVDQWFRLLPRVEPFYAAKCNPNPVILRALWEQWRELKSGGFDCASAAEMDLASALHGFDMGEQVVYANPCKQASGINHARASGVRMLVFDNAAELDKLKSLYPDASLVLRVQTDDAKAQCPLSNKFGCAPQDCAVLLQRACELDLEVVGVSFHVGSGCSELGAFRSALHRARDAFDEAAKLGLQLKLLDIGGGFPGWDEPGDATFAEHAADISGLLQELFPDPATRVIAEPGRFFVASAQSVLTTVMSVAGSAKGSRYYLNDGLYGSFNCLLYDHASVPRPTILRAGRELSAEEAGPLEPCTLFGPTCDGFDTISESMDMPRLEVGDRLLFHDMGAYTTAASTSFNGFAPANSFVFRSSGCA